MDTQILLATIQIYSIWRGGAWNFVNPWTKSFNEYNSRFYDSLKPINTSCVESRYRFEFKTRGNYGTL